MFMKKTIYLLFGFFGSFCFVFVSFPFRTDFGHLGLCALWHLGLWALGPLGTWAFGLLGLWAIGPLGSWAFG